MTTKEISFVDMFVILIVPVSFLITLLGMCISTFVDSFQDVAEQPKKCEKKEGKKSRKVQKSRNYKMEMRSGFLKLLKNKGKGFIEFATLEKSSQSPFEYICQDIPEFVLCGICGSPLEYPVFCKVCEGLFCEKCYQKDVSSDHKHDCCTSYVKFNGSGCLEVMLGSLMVKCTKSPDCKWGGSRSELADHNRVCNKSKKCRKFVYEFSTSPEDHWCDGEPRSDIELEPGKWRLQFRLSDDPMLFIQEHNESEKKENNGKYFLDFLQKRMGASFSDNVSILRLDTLSSVQEIEDLDEISGAEYSIYVYYDISNYRAISKIINEYIEENTYFSAVPKFRPRIVCPDGTEIEFCQEFSGLLPGYECRNLVLEVPAGESYRLDVQTEWEYYCPYIGGGAFNEKERYFELRFNTDKISQDTHDFGASTSVLLFPPTYTKHIKYSNNIIIQTERF